MRVAEATTSSTTKLDRVFRASLVLKGADGILELVGGLLLLVVSPARMNDIVRALTQHELSEDPHDLIANYLVHAVSQLSVSTTVFGAIYLLLHGVVKIVLVAAVLADKLWAYPWMIGFLLVFIAYQGYRLVIGFSWGLLVLTVFDIFIMVLTWREYRLRRAKKLPHLDSNQEPIG